MSAVVYGLKDYNTLSQNPHEYVPAISILYGGFHRLAWGVAVSWMVYACHMGYGGEWHQSFRRPDTLSGIHVVDVDNKITSHQSCPSCGVVMARVKVWFSLYIM